MQRPDKDIIRRVLTQAKKFSRPEVFKNIKENVEIALTLPLVSLGDHCFDSSSVFNWYHGDFLTQGGREHEEEAVAFEANSREGAWAGQIIQAHFQRKGAGGKTIG